MKKRGRPFVYTNVLADKIIAGLSAGKSLVTVCKELDIKHSTVINWATNDLYGFAERYARARREGLDVLADDLIGLSDSEMERLPDGKIDPSAVNHRRLQIDTRKWVLSKMAPNKYGDKAALELTGKEGGPVAIDDLGASERLAKILALAALRKLGSYSEDVGE